MTRHPQQAEEIIDDLSWFDFEPIQKKKNYTIRMDVRFCKEINQEESEMLLHRALSNIGVTATCGGIHWLKGE